MKIDVVALKMARMATTQPHVHVATAKTAATPQMPANLFTESTI
jgi:hypothetical protein